MRRPILPVLACFLICFSDVDSAFSKGGRGRGGGNGGGRSAARGGNGGNNGNRPAIAPQNRGGRNRPEAPGRPQHAGSRGNEQNRVGPFTAPTDSTDATGRLTGREHALDVQRRNEERKLEHRLQTAEHLRENAARNGNQNLLDTADRMEQRAYEHYESRLSRIDGNVTDSDGHSSDLTDLVNGDAAEQLETAGDQLGSSGDVTDVLDGDADPIARRLASEERKLQHQLDVAQQLRDIAARNGNENLIQTAERMEEMAVTRYERQLDNLLLPESESVPLTEAVEAVVE